MPYQFSVQGIPVTCDTLSELLEAVKSGVVDSRPGEVQAVPAAAARGEVGAKKKPGPQGSGPKRAWAEAEEYAKKHNISISEARGIISRKRREPKEA
ncbi:MAG: hypothetical protein ACTHK7_15960, partial [Aureliella sp.]